jgi:hypothetical protein
LTAIVLITPIINAKGRKCQEKTEKKEKNLQGREAARLQRAAGTASPCRRKTEETSEEEVFDN